jgi:hypothetical protein
MWVEFAKIQCCMISAGCSIARAVSSDFREGSFERGDDSARGLRLFIEIYDAVGYEREAPPGGWDLYIGMGLAMDACESHARQAGEAFRGIPVHAAGTDEGCRGARSAQRMKLGPSEDAVGRQRFVEMQSPIVFRGGNMRSKENTDG